MAPRIIIHTSRRRIQLSSMFVRIIIIRLTLSCIISCSLAERDVNVGGGNNDNNDVSYTLQGTTDEKEELERVFVRYKYGERNVALETLATETTLANADTSTTIVYDFDDLNSFVMLASREEIENLERNVLVAEIEIDPRRYRMHIPESIEPIIDIDDKQDKNNNNLRRHDNNDERKGRKKGRSLMQENTQSIPYGVEMVGAPQAWEHGIRGDGVKVCIVDTGLDVAHNDIVSERVVGEENGLQWENDVHGHGTHITGTVAGADNSFGIVGVAPNVDLYVVKVFDSHGDFAYSSGLIAAARRCRDMGADIINMSLGGHISSNFEELAFEQLYQEGIVLVSAAGNSGGNAFTYPASYDSVLSVAGIDENKYLGPFSQRNVAVNIAAPGVRILSTLPNNQYGTMSGTSMATPHVSGVAALLKSYKPDATSLDIVNAIVDTAEDLGVDGKDISYGSGLISAMNALEYLNNGQPIGGLGVTGHEEEVVAQDDCVDITMRLFTDGYPEETSVELVSRQGATIWSMEGPDLEANEEYYYSTCEDRTGCYTFTLRDSYGDGLCCQFGSGGLAVFYDDIPIARGYFFGYEESFRLGDGCWDE